LGRARRTLIQRLGLKVMVPPHDRRMPVTRWLANGPRVLEKQYRCTSLETCGKTA
jgi:hypothetical protein